jgi:predicted ATP-dependent endonuclease of OLD family
MIHRVEIENYGSIRERQVIDLRIPATAPDLERFAHSWGDDSVRLPTVVAFFGPNASGKTTVLRAIVSAAEFAAFSVKLDPGDSMPFLQPFRSAEWRNRPTQIQVDFDANWIGDSPHVFRYKLSVARDAAAAEPRVLHESLQVRDGRRFRFLFKRDERVIRCAKELQLPPSDARLKAVRPNASVISTMAQLNHELFSDVVEDLASTQRNIRGYHASPNIKDALSFLDANREALDALILQLTRLDIGLTDLTLEKTPYGLAATFLHEGLDEGVALLEESNGTRSFITNFPALWYSLKTGRPVLIDEFDVDLHPILIPEILSWFQDPALNENEHRAQLFFAAHNVSIMDALEKEEIYLVEKSRDGASSIIGLKDVRGVRREPSLQRKYLGGVFGAVPNIG